MGQGLENWQQVLLDGLAEHDVVGVRSVVEGHLGRQPTRAESEAARRAAHLLERSGLARVAHVCVPSERGGGVVLAVPAEPTPADTPEEASDQVGGDGKKQQSPRPGGSQSRCCHGCWQSADTSVPGPTDLDQDVTKRVAGPNSHNLPGENPWSAIRGRK